MGNEDDARKVAARHIHSNDNKGYGIAQRRSMLAADIASALRDAERRGFEKAAAIAAERARVLNVLGSDANEPWMGNHAALQAERRLEALHIEDAIRALAPSREPEKTCRTCGASWSSDCAECAKSDRGPACAGGAS